ncbi:MAG: RagB/SusD family nutrient uptake outer membrane protein [Dysgonamonadaceae bacterium]|jgi:hypothetical protein|nr:RagB/SusD family nutrient uptake outer membrane protein [Dysgonamonadaceae bacterium]
MKKLAILLLALGTMVGCEDFLTPDVLTTKTSENYPTTDQEAAELLAGVYSRMLFQDPEISSQIYIAQLAGDECLGGNLSGSNNCATNFLMYTNLNLYIGYNEGDNWVPGLWSRDYQLIYRANVALEAFENYKGWASEAEKNRHLGEVYFLRAYAYNELAQVFGGVPLRLGTDMEQLERASVDDIYGQIASDLKNAIELMPATSYMGNVSLAGHVTKYAAEAFMARVFLFYTGRYAKSELPGGITKQQVIAWIDDCVDNSGHRLVSDQRNLWGYTNSATNDNTAGYRYKYVVNNNLQWEGLNADETVFAHKFKLKGNSWTYTWYSNTVSQFFSPSADDYSVSESYPFGSGWGAGPVSPAFVEEWKTWSARQTYIDGATEDPRLKGSIWSYNALDPNNAGKVLLSDRKLSSDEPDYTVSKRYYEQTGYFQKKYINIVSYYNNSFTSFGLQLFPDDAPSVVSQSLNQIADLIIIRFADVLLMQSELKEDATGLNRVRARSHLAPVAYSLDAIKNERRYELAFEAVRWFDLLRWSGPSLEEAGNALNKQTGFTLVNAAQVVPMVQFDYKARLQKTQGYWPIPQTEIDLSNGLLEQNPGWGAEALFKDWNNM